MNTEYRDIRNLLEKYWQGETDIAEEKRIKNFFSQHAEKLPDDIEEVRGLFSFYEKELQISAPEFSFPAIQEIKTGKKSSGTIFLLLRKYWEYAAIVLLLTGSVILYQPVHHHKSLVASEDTYQDPQKAFEATQKALELLAANLNKGKTGMEKLALLNQAEQTVKGTNRR